MKKFKLTPEQKAHIKSLDCECKKKDAKKRFKIENELRFYGCPLKVSIFSYAMKDLKESLIRWKDYYNEITNQIEVKAEEVVKEENKDVWIVFDAGVIIDLFDSESKARLKCQENPSKYYFGRQELK